MRRIALVCVALGIGTASSARAADYWVAPSGTDAPAGGSMGAPWKTLAYAAGRVDPGDTVHVLDGSYTGVYIDRAGMMGAPITFVAEGSAVLITAPNDTTPDGINVEGADWVVIDGFVVNDMPRTGVRCALSAHVTIRRIHADRNKKWGILTGFCDDVIIEDNVTSRSIDEHGIYHSNSADRPIIRRNVSWGNNANGIHMNGDVSLGGDGVISNALVEKNVIYDNGAAGGSGINCDGVADSIIRNNLIYAAKASGISLYQIDAGDAAKNNQVINNTVVVGATGRWALNIRDGATGTKVRNNIFLTYHPFRGSIVITDDSLTGFSTDYNVLTPRMSADGDSTILDLGEWQALGYDTNSVMSTPDAVFADAAGDDYHLKLGSPALDGAEAASAPADDIEGNARPAGSGPDIGAYEFASAPPADGGADASPETAAEPTIEPAPEPAIDAPIEPAPEPAVDAPIEPAPEPMPEPAVEPAVDAGVDAPAMDAPPPMDPPATDAPVADAPAADAPAADASKPEAASDAPASDGPKDGAADAGSDTGASDGAPDASGDASKSDGGNDGKPGQDGAGMPEPGRTGSGCGCRVGAESRAPSVLTLFIAVGIALGQRRRRRRGGSA